MAATARALINRENAQASTGPKTESGKEASKMNALGHGLTSKTVVLPHENAEDYQAVHCGLIEAHRPTNDNEKVLVEHVAQAYWRLQRCYAVESAFLDNRIAASDQEPEAAMANLFIDKAESARMRLLMRYLGSAERAYNKALSDLQKAQAARRKQEREDAAAEAFTEIYQPAGGAGWQPAADCESAFSLDRASAGFVSHASQTAESAAVR
jgi:hypothetical protein